MSTLNSTQRSFLERTIVKARKLAESGAEKALQNLAVENAEPFSHMDSEQRALRRRLRSKARLLGDKIINGKQEIKHLSYELAYEYWHKMLFAKFLEANNLLVHPEHQVAVSFEDCEEFAKEEGYTDKWAAAANYASYMLPAIFRPEDPLMQVDYATEDRLALEQLLESIEEQIFVADDSLGWVYQFWQSAEKERINKSGENIDGEKLPAVTQLFTEPYMVHFLIDNTIGAWWVNRNPNVKPPVEFEYLRLLDNGTPAAGKFEGWPDTTQEVTTLDPCMGSGHFIVELFNVMTPLRIFEEDLTKEEATRKIISENLHGLEIDPRCTQIAAFNLALTAWKFNGKVIELPELNLACSGIAPKGKKEDWVKLVSYVDDEYDRTRMENGMELLYDHFQLAPELGSLLDPTIIKSEVYSTSFDQLQFILDRALKNEDDFDIRERGIAAAGIAKSGTLLSNKYDLLITNVPFLGRLRQSGWLFKYFEEYYPDSKSDLATIFVEKLLFLSKYNGVISTVMPQNWLFSTSYKRFRTKLLQKYSWSFVVRLGSGAFQEITGEVVKPILLSIKKSQSDEDPKVLTIDVENENKIVNKIIGIKDNSSIFYKQNEQLKNPDSRFTFGQIDTRGIILETIADAYQGLITGDRSSFIFKFWEINRLSHEWDLYADSYSEESGIHGKENIIFWERGNGRLHRLAEINRDRLHDMHESGNNSWGKKGILLTRIGLKAMPYFGEKYDNNLICITPKKENNLKKIWNFCSSSEYKTQIKLLDQKLSLTNATATKVNIVLDEWNSSEYFPSTHTDLATQWFFHGHPMQSEQPLQVALSRLLGYQWPAELDKEMELSSEAQKCIREIQVFNQLADEDGIVCIPSVNGEQPAADRLRNYIKEVWQEDWDNNTITNLLKESGSSKTNLEQWLRDNFFGQHLKIFNNRPFIWHIWDGRKDGFSALVNYHQLDRAHLQTLIYTYLGDWIRQCELKVKDNESGAEGLLSAAKKLKEKLELILEGEPPYDIFVRWKSAEEQSIGWEPDLNDGVRLNIYPFMQTGILRKRPNIKWGKDRGKNPPDSHWGPERCNRYEDLDDEYKLKDENGNPIPHLTNEVKRKIRE